jgi:hypothetical protein
MRSNPPEIALRQVGFRPDDNILIIGGPGSGKSRLIRYLVSVWSSNRRLIVPDLMEIHRQDPSPHWVELGPESSETELMQALSGSASIYLPVPQTRNGFDIPSFVERVGDVVRHVPDVPPSVLIVDEAQYSGYGGEPGGHPLAFVQRRPDKKVPATAELLHRAFSLAGVGVPEALVSKTRRRSLSVVVSVQFLVQLSKIPAPAFDVVVIGGSSFREEAAAARSLAPHVLPSPETIQALPTGQFFVVRRPGLRARHIARTDLPAGW